MTDGPQTVLFFSTTFIGDVSPDPINDGNTDFTAPPYLSSPVHVRLGGGRQVRTKLDSVKIGVLKIRVGTLPAPSSTADANNALLRNTRV